MNAHYAFGVTIRLEPAAADVSLDSPTVERRCLLEAPEPGSEGWRLFRDLLWRGAVGDESHVRDVLTEKVGLQVEAVDFRALYADEAYLEALRGEIADDLEAFRAESVTEVLHKYLGSSIVVDGEDWSSH